MLNNNPNKFKVKSIHDIKKENKRLKKVKSLHAKQKWVLTVMLLFLSVAMISFTNMQKKYYVVSVNNVSVGVIEKNEDLKRIVDRLKKKIAEENNLEEIDFNEQLQTTTVKRSKAELTKESEMLKKLEEELSYKIKAYNISVNGIERIILENKDQINEVLNIVKGKYDDSKTTLGFIEDENLLKQHFAGDVKIDSRFVDKKDIMNITDAVTKAESIEEVEQYVVLDGDTLSKIALKFSISVDDIVMANKNFTQNTILKVGDKINLILPRPILSVIHSRQESYTSILERPIEKRLNTSKYEDYVKVLEEGRDGKKEVLLKVNMINDVDVSKEVINENVIEEAIAKVMEVGTLKLPAKPMTGLFLMPTRGTYTSPFGEIRGSAVHKGLDIANEEGTPVYASYMGTVISAGIKGGYGYCVEIQHSSGYETLYGHLNSIAVKVGDKLNKGDLVGRMGNTGDSTGNHLHFEIKKDGVHLNPSNFVK